VEVLNAFSWSENEFNIQRSKAESVEKRLSIKQSNPNIIQPLSKLV
jgi:hypothetical protein